MTTDILRQSLLSLSLDDFTIRLYLQLISGYNPTITILAKKLGVQRLKIYNSLKQLEELRLIQRKKSGRETYIQVQSPERVSVLLRQKQNSLHTISQNLDKFLPDYILRFQSTIQSGVSSSVYEGRDSFLAIFDQILDEATVPISDSNPNVNLYHFGCIEGIIKLIGVPAAKEWVARRTRLGIATREICFPSGYLHTQTGWIEQSQTTAKILPNTLDHSASFMIFHNKAIWWNAILPRVVVIQDQVIVQLMKLNFELLWKNLP